MPQGAFYDQDLAAVEGREMGDDASLRLRVTFTLLWKQSLKIPCLSLSSSPTPEVQAGPHYEETPTPAPDITLLTGFCDGEGKEEGHAEPAVPFSLDSKDLPPSRSIAPTMPPFPLPNWPLRVAAPWKIPILAPDPGFGGFRNSILPAWSMPDEKVRTLSKEGSVSGVTSMAPITRETKHRSDRFFVSKEIFEEQE